MRLSKMTGANVIKNIFIKRQPNHLSAWRQFIVGSIVISLAGCSVLEDDESQIPQGTIGYVQGNLGGVTADEPRAALVGRDALAAGGTAADAAVATFFTLVVTLPSSVSLGGGGVCLVRDHKTQSVETLDFRAKAPRSAGNNRNAAAIPGSPRGIFALHAKYGNLKWGELMRPAENLARFGTEISRALGQDLKVANAEIWPNADMRETFAAPGATALYKEGAFFKQVPLSATLARLRSRGASDLYNGQFARQFTNAAQATGPAFTYEELRAYIPEWRGTIEVPFIRDTVFHFPTPPGSAGVTAAQIAAMLSNDDRYEDLDEIERAHLLVEAVERSLADRARWQRGNLSPSEIVSKAVTARLVRDFDPEKRNPTSSVAAAPTDSLAKSRGASFSIVDRNGSAVACSFTMNKPFGAQRIARGTGVVLAASPPAHQSEDALASVILVRKSKSALYYASAASGGAAAPSALVNVVANGIVGSDTTLEQAIALKRVHHGGSDGITYLEKSINPVIVNGLGAIGHKMAYVRNLGYVNAIFCSAGLPNKNSVSCEVKSDPRGFGLGIGSD